MEEREAKTNSEEEKEKSWIANAEGMVEEAAVHLIEEEGLIGYENILEYLQTRKYPKELNNRDKEAF